MKFHSTILFKATAAGLLALALSVLGSMAAPADFNAFAGFGIVHSKTINLFFEPVVTSGTLVSETTEPDGRIRLAFNFTVSNPGGGYQEGVKVIKADTFPWVVAHVTLAAVGGDLAPGTVAIPTVLTTTSPLELLCQPADTESIKTALLAAQHVQSETRELVQFGVPVKVLDQASAFVYDYDDSTSTHLVFTASTPWLSQLVPGDILLEDSTVYELIQQSRPDGLLSNLLSDVMLDLRAAVSGNLGELVFKVLAVTTLPGGAVEVTGEYVPLDTVVSAATETVGQSDAYSGSPRDPYRPSNGASFRAAPDEFDAWQDILDGINPLIPDDDLPSDDPQRAAFEGFFSMHFPINDLQLIPGVTLDGGLMLKALDFRFVRIKRDGTVRRVGVRLTNHVETTLRLTADSGKNLAPLEKTIVTVPLPPITIPIGSYPLTLNPTFTAKVGCDLNAPTRFQVPLTASVEAGFFMGWNLDKPEGERAVFLPISNSTPPVISDPLIGQALSLTATAWVEAALDVLINNVGGPGITARVEGNFNVAPTSTPWWSIAADFELNGRLRLAIPFFPDIDAVAPLYHPPELFRISATQPPSTHGSGPLDHAAGDQNRWARAAQINAAGPDEVSSRKRDQGNVSRVAGTAEDVFIVQDIGGSTGCSISRVNPYGDHVWTRAINSVPLLSVGTPDGGLVLSNSSGNRVRLFKYDGDGNLLWQKSLTYTPTGGGGTAIDDVRLLTVPTVTSHEILFIANLTVAGDSGAMMMRCDASGNVLAIHRFNSSDTFFLQDADLAPDGNIVACGYAFPRSPVETAESYGLTLPISRNQAILTKWNTTTGAQIWGKMDRTFRGNQYDSLSVAPNGSIYTAGKLGLVLGNQYGSMQVTSHSSGGFRGAGLTLSDGAGTAGGASTSAAVIDTGTAFRLTGSDPVAGRINSTGNTIQDEGVRIQWTPAGIVVAGNTSADLDRAFMTACFSEDMHVRWLTSHEQTGDDQVFDFVSTENGLFVLGSSDNMLRNAVGAASNTENCTLMLKLPRDGMTDLKSHLGIAHGYLAPGVHDHGLNWGDAAAFQPSYVDSVDFTFATTAEPTNAAGTTFLLNPSAFTTPPVTHWIPLENGRINEPMTYAQWAAFYLLADPDPKANADADERTNGGEYFFGGSPVTQEGPAITEIQRDPLTSDLTISATRSKSAALQTPIFTFSPDLDHWFPMVPAPSIGVSSLTDLLDQIQVTLVPSTGPSEFYRFESPPLSAP